MEKKVGEARPPEEGAKITGDHEGQQSPVSGTALKPPTDGSENAALPGEELAQSEAVSQNHQSQPQPPSSSKDETSPETPASSAAMDHIPAETRKRTAPDDIENNAVAGTKDRTSEAGPSGSISQAGFDGSDASPAKKAKYRVNQPWTPAEEQRLKVLRDAGNSWSQIAKDFPNRTEGSVKKHWYKV